MIAGRRMLIAATTAASLLVVAAVTGWAADTAEQSKDMGWGTGAVGEKGTDASAKAFTPKLVDCNALIGSKVTNAKGEDIGKIEDIVLDAQREHISYAAVGYGGTLGMGRKYAAVPWDALSIQAPTRDKVQKVALNVDKKSFDSAMGFDKDHWPNEGNPLWAKSKSSLAAEGTSAVKEGVGAAVGAAGQAGPKAAEGAAAAQKGVGAGMEAAGQAGAKAAEDYIETEGTTGPAGPKAAEGVTGMEGATPRGKTSGHDMRFRRLTDIVGLKVKDSSSQDVGDIEDVVVDVNVNEPVYAVVGFGGMLGMGEKFAAVPWSAVDISPRKNEARIDATRSYIQSEAYEPSNRPDLSDKAEAEKVYKRYNETPYWQTTAGEAWKAGSKYNAAFDPKTVTTETGVVESVGTFRPEANAADGLRLKFKTADGKTITVYAGPKSYADKQGFTVQRGDQIDVTGSKTTVNGRSVVMAKSVRSGDRMLDLRGDDGRPKWSSMKD